MAQGSFALWTLTMVMERWKVEPFANLHFEWLPTAYQSTAWVPIPIGFTVHIQNHWILSGFRIGLNLNGYGCGCPFIIMDHPFNVDMRTNL
jgi:hypothetical protein